MLVAAPTGRWKIQSFQGFAESLGRGQGGGKEREEKVLLLGLISLADLCEL